MHSLCIGHDLEGTLHDNDIRILPVVNILAHYRFERRCSEVAKLRAHDDERVLSWLCSLAVVHRRSKGEDPADQQKVRQLLLLDGRNARLGICT